MSHNISRNKFLSLNQWLVTKFLSFIILRKLKVMIYSKTNLHILISWRNDLPSSKSKHFRSLSALRYLFSSRFYGVESLLDQKCLVMRCLEFLWHSRWTELCSLSFWFRHFSHLDLIWHLYLLYLLYLCILALFYFCLKRTILGFLELSSCKVLQMLFECKINWM